MSNPRWRIATWLLAVISFSLGSYIGWTTHAQIGISLWGLAALLGLLPFLSHRTERGGTRPPFGG